MPKFTPKQVEHIVKEIQALRGDVRNRIMNTLWSGEITDAQVDIANGLTREVIDIASQAVRDGKYYLQGGRGGLKGWLLAIAQYHAEESEAS